MNQVNGDSKNVIFKNVILKTVFVGISFLFLFTAFNLSFGFLTTLFQDLGFYSIALIYGPYSLSSLISPWIGRRLGVRFSILLGSLTYIIWIMSLPIGDQSLLLILSIFNGLGSGLLWVHQGIWLTNLIQADTEEDKKDPGAIEENKPPNILEINTEKIKSRAGLLTGIFLGLYNLNGIIGSILVMVMSNFINITTILWILFGIAGLSWICFWFIPYPSNRDWILVWNKLKAIKKEIKEEILDSIPIINSPPSARANLSIALNPTPTLSDHFRKLMDIWSLPGFYLLIPLIFQCSMSIIFSYGVLPLLMKNSHQDLMDKIDYELSFMISGLFLSYGVSSAIFSVIWGKLYDKIGAKLLIASKQILVLIQYGYILIQILLLEEINKSWVGIIQWWIIAFFSGAIDTNAVGLVNMILSRQYKSEDAPFLFAWYRFFYCIFYAIFSILNIFLPMWGIVCIIMVWSLLASISGVIFLRKNVNECQ